MGIRPIAIAGTSMGAVVGAAYAAEIEGRATRPDFFRASQILRAAEGSNEELKIYAPEADESAREGLKTAPRASFAPRINSRPFITVLPARCP
jgi:predicted acylesterase/phospholipase RssA